ncbi:dihydropyrimidinase [Actinoplanes lutulentus]|uniref:Dihydropyrimidinase n=1 Tax=Actinoplanes lutulentus TaxID=1287878 RepID=A0A327Z157_9ACTN|nr:amidohydrolase family protein [Actinoplanes lutulentus]MBB2946506.1 dihydropyrimidinase [Actinoplanes lutulentus]RAK26424.1 dihydropyrimidinase [Actinoplanes lutulentus]
MTTDPLFDLVLTGGTVVRPRDVPRPADVGIRDGKIAAVLTPGAAVEAAERLDITGLHVFPGGVDPHNHIALSTSGLEEYRTDTAAAAKGGVTTMMYMLSSGGSYLPMLEEHTTTASSLAYIDFGYHCTLMTDQHLTEIDEVRQRYGLRSFKYFMHFRGDEGQYLNVEGTHDGRFFGIAKAVAERGDLLLVHAENPEVVWVLRDELIAAGRDDLAAWDESRPPFVEAEAIRKATFFAQRTGCRMYFVHVSTADSLDQLRKARLEFASDALFAETCPHYLTHTSDWEGGVVGKVNPPLRTAGHPEALWTALADGTVDTLGSDHVGRQRVAKEGGIWKASAGFPGAPTTLPVLLSEGYHRRGLPLQRIAELTAKRPAELIQADHRKGDIAVGLDADLAIVDLERTRTPDPQWLGTFSDYSLYEDMPLRGWPRHTLVRGQFVVRDEELVGESGYGSSIREVAP